MTESLNENWKKEDKKPKDNFNFGSWQKAIKENPDLFKQHKQFVSFNFDDLVDVGKAHGWDKHPVFNASIQAMIHGESSFKIIENLMSIILQQENNMLEREKHSLNLKIFKQLKPEVQKELLDALDLKLKITINED